MTKTEKFLALDSLLFEMAKIEHISVIKLCEKLNLDVDKIGNIENDVVDSVDYDRHAINDRKIELIQKLYEEII